MWSIAFGSSVSFGFGLGFGQISDHVPLAVSWRGGLSGEHLFPALLHLEDADTAGIKLLQDVQQTARSLTEFQHYDGGTPILFNKVKNGRDLLCKEMVNVLRDYFHLHYGEALAYKHAVWAI